MSNKKSKTKWYLILFSAIITILILTGILVTQIYAWVTYAGKPVEEIPKWALFFMLRL